MSVLRNANVVRVGYILCFTSAVLHVLSGIAQMFLREFSQAMESFAWAGALFLIGSNLMDKAHLYSYARIERTYQGGVLSLELRVDENGKQSGTIFGGVKS